MNNIAKPAMAVAVLAAIGIGCYTWGEHNNKPVSDNSLSQPGPNTVPGPLMPAPTSVNASQLVPLSASPQQAGPAVGDTSQGGNTIAPSGAPPGYGSASSNLPPGASSYHTMTQTTTEEADHAPVTHTEETTTTTTATPVHRAYTRRIVHYRHHKSGKVHVARATKHGVSFAVKLPGRLAL